MTRINPVTTLTVDRNIAIIAVSSPPVNALSAAVRNGVADALAQAIAGDAEAIVLICEGKTFFAGMDITELGGGMPTGASLLDIQGSIENSPKLVVAAMHGTVLGGGLELALCAHHRIGLPLTKLGLPEVNLGLIPGAGGTQRLPRLIGVAGALDMIVLGKQLSATAALEMGLLDAIISDGDLRSGAIAYARSIVTMPLARVRDQDAHLAESRADPGIFDAFRKANARRFRGFSAPEAAISCVEVAVRGDDFNEGLTYEHARFIDLLNGSQSQAQRYYFFAERQASRIPDVPPDTSPRPVHKVGILGAGTMGGGIAMCFANIGLPVTIVDMKAEALDRGVATIRKNYERSAARGSISPADVDARMTLIGGALSIDAFADCDLVIEAVFERMDVKKDVFTRLDGVCKPGAILATNTSGLDVDEIASVTGRPEDVIGLHFFSPANVMKLLEVIRGDRTGKDVIATAMALAKRIGKIAVLAGVCPGFIGNRVLMPRQYESDRLVQEGVLPWEVDRVLQDFGLPMGPFAMADLAGLDLSWVRAKSKGATIREVLNEAGRHGQKSGAGWYDYDEKRVAHPSAVTEKVIRDFVPHPRAIDDTEILERSLFPQINEGAKLLEEGKAIRASDIDVVWVNGYGWPVYRGGPMYYADSVGLDRIVGRLREWHATRGEAFRPSPLLEQLAAEGKRISDYVQPQRDAIPA